MAAFMDKMMVNTAITDNTKMDLSCDHVTTSSFFDIHPVYIKEMVPGESLNMRAQVFARLQPLLNPTFGRCNVNARAFFVPMRTLWLQWNNFITDSPYVDGQTYNNQVAPSGYVPVTVPTTSAEQICELFCRHCGTAFVGVSADTEWGNTTTSAYPYDYAFYVPANGGSTASTTEYIVLNEKGRRVVKVLESLGYKVPCYKNSALGTFSSGDDQYSMLPLFAYAKIYIDWYVNSAYSVSNNDVAYIQSYLNSTSAAGPVSTGALYTILNFIISANYDSDYFVSAWDNPVAPAAGTYSSMSMVDITITNANMSPASTSNTSVTMASISGTPYMTQTSSSSANIGSKYIHDVLNSMSDYVKRHQLVGAHAFDRYLARFGKALNSEKLRRSVYIGSKITPVQFGDVMSNSGSNITGTQNTTSLGDYAGKGVAYGDGQFDFSTDEYGYFIVIGTIIPAVGYVQGIDRMITHVTKLDFWTPEFDNLGVQAIRKDELYLSKDGSSTLGQYSSMGAAGNPFGFIPRYAEYKVAKDKLTGEFTFNSRNAGMDSWYGFRMFDDANFTNGASDVVHGYDFTSGEADGDQYNRIFRNWNSKSTFDQFYMIWHFDVRDNSPMKSLFDSYEFESEDEGSKKVTEQAGGVKMN